jgi:hypothetical protein
MNLPAASCGVSKGRISILIPLTLTLSRRGEREPKVTLQRATGNYQVQNPVIWKIDIGCWRLNKMINYDDGVTSF